LLNYDLYPEKRERIKACLCIISIPDDLLEWGKEYLAKKTAQNCGSTNWHHTEKYLMEFPTFLEPGCQCYRRNMVLALPVTAGME